MLAQVGAVDAYQVCGEPSGLVHYVSPAASTLWQGMISATGSFAIAWPPQPLGMGRLRAAWSWLKQTDLIPDKGQFRSGFHHPRSAIVVRQRFFGIFWPLFLAWLRAVL